MNSKQFSQYFTVLSTSIQKPRVTAIHEMAYEAVKAMPEFMFPLAPRDQGWIELRERLARAARDIHFVAVSKDVRNGAELLTISENFADLAMSIPVSLRALADLGGPSKAATSDK